MHHGHTHDGLFPSGLSIVCETCESDIDFPDDHSELGVCRQCGIAFLVDLPAADARVS